MSYFDIKEHFKKFSENIKTSESNNETIKCRKNTIRDIINNQYWDGLKNKNHGFIVGSYGRGTSINVSDVDLLVELPNSERDRFDKHSGNSESQLLQDVKNALKKHYANSEIKGDGQIVSINFKDGIKFEILPAFKNNINKYIFPNTHSGGNWDNTNPREEQKRITELNIEYKSIVKRFAKMLRAWKSENNVKISGIEIDSFIYTFFNNYNWDKTKTSYNYFDVLSKTFFDWLNCFCRNNDSVSSILDDYRIEISDDLISKSNSVIKRVSKAIDFQNNGDNINAEREWRKVYGNKFPIFQENEKNVFISTKKDRAYLPINVDDTEEFADEKWNLDNNVIKVNVNAKLETNGFMIKRIEEFLKKLKFIPIKNNSILKFKIDTSLVNNNDIVWFWKVRNVGEVANNKNIIRGQIFKNGFEHDEPISFRGNHYVEVYGINKNNKLKYFGRIDVPLHEYTT